MHDLASAILLCKIFIQIREDSPSVEAPYTL